MDVRITKAPPAPKMDGFDVRGLHVGHVYSVDDRLAWYLVAAGYAQLVVTNSASTSSAPRESDEA